MVYVNDDDDVDTDDTISFGMCVRVKMFASYGHNLLTMSVIIQLLLAT